MEEIIGRWLGVERAPGDRRMIDDGEGVYGVHAALLRTGRVIIFSGGLENDDLNEVLFRSWTWDPATYVPGEALTGVEGRWFLSDFDADGPMPSPPGRRPQWSDDPDVDLFCAHHVNLEDGRLLAVGGTKRPPFSRGNNAIATYDPDAEAWTMSENRLVKGRWYPTAVVLADGRIAVFSGRPDQGIEETAEILNPESLESQVIDGGNRRLYIYPGLVEVPGGAIFYVPTAWQYNEDDEAAVRAGIGPTSSFRMTGTTSGAWTEHDDPVDPNEELVPENTLREEGTFVLLPPARDGRIMVIGGGFAIDPNESFADQRSTEMDLCEILHTQGGSPRWSVAGEMRRPRSNVHAVLLPDGNVLTVGGHDGAKRNHSPEADTGHLVPEMYDPTVPYDPADPSAAFTDMAPMGSSRLYHAAALLLPDGRVLLVGGEDAQHAYPEKRGNALHSMEIYEPPYCHQGDRPVIDRIVGIDAPDDELAYGRPFDIVTPQAGDIASVVLMRLGSATHHTDTEQRHVPLSFYATGDQLRAFAEADPTVAPPGWYMLFLVDDDGRPCERAEIVRLSRRACHLITDRSTISSDEVAASGTTTVPTAFYVHLDGFLPSELGITTATPTATQLESLAPAVQFQLGDADAPGLSAVATALHLEDDALAAGEHQRVTFEYAIEVASTASFPTVDGDAVTVALEATKTLPILGEDKSWTCDGELTLTRSANPYLLDGPTHWLSIDVRVFRVRDGDDPFGVSTPVTDPTGYIQELIADWQALGPDGHPFGSLTEDQGESALTLSRTEGGEAVYNFAVARVRYRGRNLPATDARVFFRLFSTANTNMVFDPSTTYRRHTRAGGQTVPLLGIRSGEVASIPFFAVPRIDSTSFSMTDQPEDSPNTRTLPPVGPGGAEEHHYFGAWLDINQTIGRFPRTPGTGNGAYAPADVIAVRDLINGRHQCLVAEIHLDDDPTPLGAEPSTSDNLSQRNLAIEGSDNPGGPDGHTVALTFEIDPTWDLRTAVGRWKETALYAARGPVPGQGGIHGDHDHDMLRGRLDEHDGDDNGVHGGDLVEPDDQATHDDPQQPPPDLLERRAVTIAARRQAIAAAAEVAARDLRTPEVAYRPGRHDHAGAPVLRWLQPDELMIDWGDLPRSTRAELHIPGLRADVVLALLGRRWGAHRFERVDDDTIAAPVGAMSHIPLPALTPRPHEALITIELPATVRMRQHFTVRIHQVSTLHARVVGTFEVQIPVRSGPQLVEAEVRWLAVLKDMLARRDADHRWTPILERLLRVVEVRVREFGVDPDAIEPSPDGHDLFPPCPPKPCTKCGHRPNDCHPDPKPGCCDQCGEPDPRPPCPCCGDPAHRRGHEAYYPVRQVLQTLDQWLRKARDDEARR